MQLRGTKRSWQWLREEVRDEERQVSGNGSHGKVLGSRGLWVRLERGGESIPAIPVLGQERRLGHLRTPRWRPRQGDVSYSE